jgi:hypothetical protein
MRGQRDGDNRKTLGRFSLAASFVLLDQIGHALRARSAKVFWRLVIRGQYRPDGTGLF